MVNKESNKIVKKKKVSNKEDKPDKEPPHPIGEAITRFVHAARDIKLGSGVFVPFAYDFMQNKIEEIKGELDNSMSLLKSKNPNDGILGVKASQEALRKYERIKYSKLATIIETSLFQSLFSAFDTYTGELLRGVYKRKPELFSKLNQMIPLVDILTTDSIDDLKDSVLNKEIETFKRKSYVEQFEELELNFGLSLRKFSRWPNFVECTQRRNLLTHCGGIVSEQYIMICKKAGYPEKDIPEFGSKVSLGPEYFFATCELMIEVGLKLGQTLWRKILGATELEHADEHLRLIQYDTLLAHNWDRAVMFGEFAVTQHKEHGVSNEVEKCLMLINYCSALKFSGNNPKAQEMLNTVDWTVSISDFRLAEAVLQDRFADAASLMAKIGESGEWVSESGYHTWPLFHKFRESKKFMKAYEKIYKRPFIDKLKSDTVALQSVADKEIKAEPTKKS